ncbi:hypothetical protein TNIN_158461 [Trichonephila inaurata madagascariensis]|uniref:Uncharacterized protein n=1 Tax=Trichonephila inaurata madagascariensis TaxID=2747483 RepID=A0A8X6WWW2_9ARAC|nr:hypothetical protein TNIN_158461 [Trichonephila inaurata madagascariensis]
MILFHLMTILSVFVIASSQNTDATPTSNLKAGTITNRVDNPILRAILNSPETPTESPKKDDHKMKRYPVASFDFDHIAAPFVITAWIFAACCAKIGFHILCTKPSKDFSYTFQKSSIILIYKAVRGPNPKR